MSDYPEHDRMMAVSEQSETIGQFLEWLSEQGVTLAEWELYRDCDAVDGPFVGDLKDWPDRAGSKWRCEGGRMVGHPASNKPGVVGGPCRTCGGTGKIERTEPRLAPAGWRIETVLARYFDIDLSKIEAEKRAMFAAMRETDS